MIIDWPNVINLIIFISLLGLLPFIIIMTTSFIKIAVVLSLIRNALGIQQAPPNMVIYGFSLVLTAYIMAPVIDDTYTRAKSMEVNFSNVHSVENFIQHSFFPIFNFLKKNTRRETKVFFLKTAKKIWPKDYSEGLSLDNFVIIAPSFITSELTSAFEMGFIVYLPFIVIDLIISNILLAMGMVMVSPLTIALPFKLLLFVVINGWSLLIEGLILSYT